MSKEEIVYPSLAIKIFVWGYLLLIGAIVVVDSVSNHSLVIWLYNALPLQYAKSVFSWFFRIFYSWLILGAIWFILLGVKSYNIAKYPPGGLPIPLKSKLVIGDRAKMKGVFLCGISLVILLFGCIFFYHDYIWTSSDL
jgi:hypothetical protein